MCVEATSFWEGDSPITVTLTEGVTYQIIIDAYFEEGGPFTLQIAYVEP